MVYGGGGAYLTSVLIGFILIKYFPVFAHIHTTKGYLDTVDTILLTFFWPFSLLHLVNPGRYFGIMLIVSILTYVIGYIFARVIAFFQGLILGGVFGAMTWGGIWFLLYILDTSSGLRLTLSWIIGGGIGVLTLLSGIFGGFLPEYKPSSIIS